MHGELPRPAVSCSGMLCCGFHLLYGSPFPEPQNPNECVFLLNGHGFEYETKIFSFEKSKGFDGIYISGLYFSSVEMKINYSPPSMLTSFSS